METKSIGKIKLTQFETSRNLAEIKVMYKRNGRQKHKVTVLTSNDSFEVLYSLFDKETIGFIEEFYVLLLNRANVVLGWVKLSSGGTSGTVVDIKIIAIIALQTNASGIILCHNHASGNMKPSLQDIQITKAVKDACQLLEIRLLDHLIVSPYNDYYSFSNDGIL
jgi:DNA repair protein RadC